MLTRLTDPPSGPGRKPEEQGGLAELTPACLNTVINGHFVRGQKSSADVNRTGGRDHSGGLQLSSVLKSRQKLGGGG